MDYRFANASDRRQLLDFIDLVFSKLRKPHDFESLLPKAYAPNADKMPIHALALEDGVIRGCVGVYPFALTLAGETLNMGYVGSVSVHHSVRGQGVMGKLMDIQIARARAEGMDALVLGGQRQRYERFNFAPCGGYYQYTVTSANMKRALTEINASGILFQPIMQNSDDESKAYALYQSGIVSGAREASRFVDASKSFEQTLWSVKRDGDFLGYIISDADKSAISEFMLSSDECVRAAVKAWIVQNNINALRVRAAPWETKLNRALAAFAEGYTLSQDEMMLCLDARRVISAYLHLQNAIHPLCDGSLTLQIDDSPAIRLNSQSGITSVQFSRETASIKLNWPQAASLLFGFNRFYAPELNARIPWDWFPLPLCIPIADTF